MSTRYWHNAPNPPPHVIPGASERVANVFSKSIDFLKLVLTGVAASIHREEVTRGLETYTKTLVEKLGNSNARVRNDANSALMAMARSNSVGPAYIAVLLLKKPKKELPTAYRVSRCVGARVACTHRPD
jgi:hypothetical protein